MKEPLAKSKIEIIVTRCCWDGGSALLHLAMRATPSQLFVPVSHYD